MDARTFIAAATTFIQLRGSGTVTPLIQAIGRQYMTERPEIGLPLLGGGTARGYKAVLDGTADIGMASGRMPTHLAKWANKRNREIAATRLAYDGIAAIVHPANPLAGLTFDQLRDVFTGEIPDWSKLGLRAGAIQVYSQDPFEGTYEVWKRIVAGEEDVITLKAKVVTGDDIIAKILGNPLGIGYASELLARRNKVKILRIDGSLPIAADIASGRYPVRRELMLATLPKPGNAVKDFLAYCTAPDKGQAIIKRAGVVPASSR